MHNFLVNSTPNNQPIILVLDYNSNPKLFLQEYICKLNQSNIFVELERYVDLFMYDATVNTFKKEDAIKLQDFCSYSSVENTNKRFYYISNFDNATKSAFNSLLKFIEEPSSNVFGVFSTSSINRIPITIRSRCHIVYLKTDEDFVAQIKQKYKELPNWVWSLFHDTSLDGFLSSERYLEFITVLDFLVNKKLDLFNLTSEIIRKKWSYLDLKLFLKALLSTSDNRLTNQILKLNESLNFNPIKSLFFQQLISIFWDNESLC